jgi:hypothetical protein
MILLPPARGPARREGTWHSSEEFLSTTAVDGRHIRTGSSKSYRYRPEFGFAISIGCGLEPPSDRVTGRMGEVLPNAQVALGGLDRSVTERELDLIECRPATIRQLCEAPPLMPHAA